MAKLTTATHNRLPPHFVSKRKNRLSRGGFEELLVALPGIEPGF